MLRVCFYYFFSFFRIDVKPTTIMLFLLLLVFCQQRQTNMQLAQLFLVYQVRCFAHHIVGILCLGEGDDVADRRTFCHQHDHTVQTEGQSSVRRRAIFKGLHHEAEFFLGFFIGETDSFKDCILNVAAMDTDGTATQ